MMMMSVEQPMECLAGETRPSAALSSTNLTWPDRGSNLSRRGGKPATNRLSYGTAYMAALHRDISSRQHKIYPQ
jgi:hypothetical protein